MTGAFTVNEKAALKNAKANQVTLSIGSPPATTTTTRARKARPGPRRSRTHGRQSKPILSNPSGAVLVNQSAGAVNLRRNSTQIGTAALGVETVPDGELSAAAPKNGSLGQSIGVHSVREANISSDAFKNVNGIVQINKTTSAGNATANRFVLRPPAATFFN